MTVDSGIKFKKIFQWILVFAFTSALNIFPAAPALAKDPRNQIIEKEFDCIRNHLKAQEGMVWNEVCYSSGEVVEPSARMDLINQALDQAASKKSRYSGKSSETETYGAPRSEYRAEPTPVEISREDHYQQDYQREEKVLDERPWHEPVDLERKKQQFEVGAEYSRINYKEPDFDVQEKGNMYGIYAHYAFHMDENDSLYNSVINMFKLEGKVSTGTVDYQGTGTVDDINDYMVEMRAMAGYDFAPSRQTRLTPYAGLGFRYLHDGFGDTGAAGTYDRSSRYLYLPIGVEFVNQLNAGWAVDMTGEFDVFLFGKQKSYFSDIDPTDPDIINDQHRGFGLRGSFAFIKKGENVNFSITPFIKYWHISNSEVTQGFFEPDNKSTEYGVKLGVQF